MEIVSGCDLKVQRKQFVLEFENLFITTIALSNRIKN